MVLLKQQLTIEEIHIFSYSSHLEWRAKLSDTNLKWDYPRTITAKFGLILRYRMYTGAVRFTKNRTVCIMVNILDDSNFHRQTAVMTRLIEMIIQNPVFVKPSPNTVQSIHIWKVPLTQHQFLYSMHLCLLWTCYLVVDMLALEIMSVHLSVFQKIFDRHSSI
jgi:hypothetical protein